MIVFLNIGIKTTYNYMLFPYLCFYLFENPYKLLEFLSQNNPILINFLIFFYFIYFSKNDIIYSSLLYYRLEIYFSILHKL